MPKLPFDPEQLPIDSIAGEAAVAPAALTVDALRRRFGAPPLWTPEELDESVGRRPVMTPAAVLIALVDRPQGVTMLLTRRTAHLNNHPGPIGATSRPPGASWSISGCGIRSGAAVTTIASNGAASGQPR